MARTRALEPDLALAAARVKAHLLNSLAAEFYARRLELDHPEAEVATRAGTSQSRFSELERGNGNPTVESLARVAAALDLEIEVSVRPAQTRVLRHEPSTPQASRARKTRPDTAAAAAVVRAAAASGR